MAETHGDTDRGNATAGRFSTDVEALQNEVVVETFKSTGPGGQRRNKKETAVRLTHVPSGITVVASERRSQAMNRDIAFQRLRARLVRLNRPVKRRIPTRPTAGSLRKREDDKRRQSHKKRLRTRLNASRNPDLD